MRLQLNFILVFIFITCFLGYSPNYLFAQNQYKLVYDFHYSSVCGAEDLLTLHKATVSFEDRYLKPKFNDEKKPVQKATGIFYRATKTVLLDDLIDYMVILTQHEIFGHGARYREFGHTNNSFHLSLVPPYGDGHGFAQSGPLKDSDRKTSECESLMKTVGGNEANTILSQHIIGNWLLRGSINYRESLLYLESANNLLAYIYLTKYSKKLSAGNDIMAYMMSMQIAYNNGERYTIDELANQGLVGIINPFQFLAAFAFSYSYLLNGTDSLKLPMINIRNVRYLPAFHYGLSPFGTEYYFDNYFVKNKKVLTTYIRVGDTKYFNSWGLGMNSMNFFSYQNLVINPCFDIGKQPAFELGGDKLVTHDAGYGGAFSSMFIWYFNKQSKTGISLQLGYKSAGYLAGENLAGGIILRAGLCFKE
jgi:hypothetical protein